MFRIPVDYFKGVRSAQPWHPRGSLRKVTIARMRPPVDANTNTLQVVVACLLLVVPHFEYSRSVSL